MNLGYNQSIADYSLFVKSVGSSFMAILVYVDDLILAGNDLVEIQAMKRLWDGKIRIKDVCDVKFFLGMEVAWSKLGIVLYKRKYTLDLLSGIGMLGAKPVLLLWITLTSCPRILGSHMKMSQATEC